MGCNNQSRSFLKPGRYPLWVWRFSLVCVLTFVSWAGAAHAQTDYASSEKYITEQEVYENVDDQDLNLQYAKQEIKRGEMLNAGSALERMLYKNPNWHSARLLYSAVLYRLDDQKAALRELTLLEGRELNEEQEITYKRYKTAFTVPPRPAFDGLGLKSPVYSGRAYAPADPIRASVTIGASADNNAGNSLTDEGFGFNNRGDVSATLEGRLQGSVPLNSTGNLKARFGVRGQIRRHETFSQADYDVYDARAGLSLRAGSGVVSVDVDARTINVSGEKYLNQIGPRFTASQPLSDTTRATVSLSFYDQDYKPLSFATGEDQRDGIRTSFQVGILKKIKRAQKVTLAAGFETKSADLRAFAYNGPVAAASYEKTLKQDLILKGQIRARQINYKDSLLPGTNDRKDLRLSARISLGVPVKKLIKAAPFKDPIIEVGASYNLRESNLQTYDYDNLGADIRLSVGF